MVKFFGCLYDESGVHPDPEKVDAVYDVHDVHDACLWKLMEVAQKYGLVFNPKTTQVKAPVVKFFGCLYDESGVHPDPAKVDAVHALPTPTNIAELQEFLGMVTYLSPSFLVFPP